MAGKRGKKKKPTATEEEAYDTASEKSDEATDGGASWKPVRLNLPTFDSSSISWEIYSRRVRNCFRLYEVPTSKQALALLDAIGEQTYVRLNDLCLPDVPESKTVDELFDILSNFFTPKPCKYAERLKFQARVQGTGETIQEFYAALRKLTQDCAFPADWLEEAICTQFIIGAQDAKLRRDLLNLNPASLKVAIEFSMNYESNMRADSKIGTGAGTSQINDYVSAVQPVDQKRRPQAQGTIFQTCIRCDRRGHDQEKCRFRGATCHKCQRIGHIATGCKNFKAQVKQVQEHYEEDNEEAPTSIDLGMKDEQVWQLTFPSSLRKKIWVPVHFREGKVEHFQVDTGAAVSLISRKKFRALEPDVKLHPSDIRLLTYTKETVNVVGVAKLMVTINDISKRVQLYVVEGERDSLLGLEWLRTFQIDWHSVIRNSLEPNTRVMNVSGSPDCQRDLENLIKAYPDVFGDGIGKIKNVIARIHVKAGSTPVYKRARLLPFSLVPKITRELERLEKEGVITKIDHSDYATPVVPIIKNDGSVRLCADFKITVNPQLVVDEHPIPNIDYLFAKLSGSKFFSKLDVRQAYTHLEVHQEDRHFITINTHKGLYQYNRLPFGISSAPAIWQRTIEKILEGIEGVAVFFDDICVASKGKEDHIRRLDEVFNRLSKYDVRVNMEKCQFFQKSIQYCGYILTHEGLKKCKDKVDAITKANEPRNVSELKSFQGLVNFYGKFVQNLSTLAYPLYELLRKGSKFDFNLECKEAVRKIKEAITSDNVLVHFDPAKRLVLATDASPVGIGAVLSHQMDDGTERPICFASRTLSAAERNYSQIDKEALSIMFGVKKFYPYIYGRRFTLITDHRPLVSIFNPKKELPKLSAIRMQHYAAYLQAFEYDIFYRKSEEHGNADALSRLPLKCEEFETMTGADIYYMHQLSVLPVTCEAIKAELENDEEIAPVIQALVKGGSPGIKTLLGHHMSEYSTQNDCLFWCHRVYIPKNLRSRVMEELHEGHQGVVKTKALARSHIWWPRIDADIETMISNCSACQQTRNNPPRVSLHSWEYPKGPMERVHVDYAGPFKNRHFLVVVDAYSKWVEVYPVTSTSTQVTIDCLTRFFASFGLPHVLVSDNGSQFKSTEFREYCESNGIRQKFCAPYHPATNGQAERIVQTLKNGLRTAIIMGNNITRGLSAFLMAYRRTPHSTTGVSPAELFLQRPLRSRLDLIREKKTKEEFKITIQDPRAGRGFEPGDHVAARFYGPGEKWRFGVIMAKQGALHYLVSIGSETHRRHVNQLRLTGARLPQHPRVDEPRGEDL